MPAHPTGLLVTLLVFITSACRPAPPTSPTLTPPTAPEVVEWLLGEQVRGPRTSNKGVYVGVVTLDLTSSPPTPVAQPQTCAPDLVQLITPGRTGTWLALDSSGQLLQHASTGWSAVPSKLPLPPIAKLVASAGSPSRLELLVTVKDRGRELHLLTLRDGHVTLIQSIEPSTFRDRRDALQRWDSGRCVDRVRDCLHLTALDRDVVLMREPALFEPRVEVTTLPRDHVFDVRYANAAGTQVHVLTTEACPPATPSVEPEAPAK